MGRRHGPHAEHAYKSAAGVDAMMALDTRYLRPHPRTMLWWAQRETCRNCAHYRLESSAAAQGSGTVEHCMAGRCWSGRTAACIDMRDQGQACGTEAALFVPADGE